MDSLIKQLEARLTQRRVARMKSVLAQRTERVAFVFEQFQHPHNLSAALRSMDAFGFQSLWLVGDRQHLSSMSKGISRGSQRWISTHVEPDVALCVKDLQAKGYRLAVSHVHHPEAVNLDSLDLEQPLALIFGNEQDGVSSAFVEAADAYFRIPTVGFVESLNVSVAVAICAHNLRTRLNQHYAGAALPQERAQSVYLDWLKRDVRYSELILARGEAD